MLAEQLTAETQRDGSLSIKPIHWLDILLFYGLYSFKYWFIVLQMDFISTEWQEPHAKVDGGFEHCGRNCIVTCLVLSV